MANIEIKEQGTIKKNVDPRTRPENRRGVPTSVDSNILGYESSITSEDDPYRNLPHSPNSLFKYRNSIERAKYEQEQRDIEAAKKASIELPFTTPRKFSSNFEKLIREKTKSTIISTQNKFTPLTDESEADIEDDEIGKIVKKRKKD